MNFEIFIKIIDVIRFFLKFVLHLLQNITELICYQITIHTKGGGCPKNSYGGEKEYESCNVP